MTTQVSSSTSTPVLDQVDVRGPRFAAWVTTSVLISVFIALAISPIAGAILLAFQTVVFGIGGALGIKRSPYSRLYARFVQKRLGPVIEREPVAPLQFAQAVGFVFAIGGLISLLAGSVPVAAGFVGAALVAAFLNAAFGICLGCKIYPFAARIFKN